MHSKDVRYFALLARDSIYTTVAYMFVYRAICYRPSACPSVCLSVTRVDQSKTVEVRIRPISPIPWML